MPRVAHLAVLAAVALVASTTADAVAPVFRGPGILLQTPRGWYASNGPSLNGVSDPVQRFVLSSYRIPAGAGGAGIYVPSSRGVVAQLAEEVPPNPSPDWRLRPAYFRLPRLGRMETLGGNRWGELLFREHGRHFYIFIWVGPQASSAQVDLLLHALDGMTITAA
jgi:hypothetical protein